MIWSFKTCCDARLQSQSNLYMYAAVYGKTIAAVFFAYRLSLSKDFLHVGYFMKAVSMVIYRNPV